MLLSEKGSRWPAGSSYQDPAREDMDFRDSITVFKGIWAGLRSVDTLWEYHPEVCVAAGFEDEA